MAKQRQVTLTAGAGFTDVLATIALHYLKIWANGDRNSVAIEYKLPDDAFATTYTTDASMGDVIERIGHGREGILGRPPNYNASGVPATGDVIIQLHAADNSAMVVNVYESESQL